ncbi:hypothetical protein F2P81_008465 [Scophthalmus maximus]|uniref:Uncharacterized protein n=1 Tax=Scophthalmus maximus TaxID=52904 RepID=A0A6A4T8H3_SCOMX|nr:hypothetical protein F2P81_008465 [Scophthalmus maximus]
MYTVNRCSTCRTWRRESDRRGDTTDSHGTQKSFSVIRRVGWAADAPKASQSIESYYVGPSRAGRRRYVEAVDGGLADLQELQLQRLIRRLLLPSSVSCRRSIAERSQTRNQT